MRYCQVKSLNLPVLGQGGWELGDEARNEADEIRALRRGLELGQSLFDTAEMYGGGRSEQLIAKALRDVPRSSYQLVSKLLPQNADLSGLTRCLDASLKRLNTDYLDLYLLHWRGNLPLEETIYGLEQGVRAGKIRHWGVSNFDVCDMEDLWAIPGGEHCAVNQVLYNLTSRGIEFDLLPWMHAHDVALMAYCPIAQAGALARMGKKPLLDPLLHDIADKYGIRVIELLLAFTIRQAGAIAIPKSASEAHVEANIRAAEIQIAEADWEAITVNYPAPSCKMHLDID